MIIKALCKFKHDTFIAEEGKSYDVPEGLAATFINNGWAEGPDGQRVYTVPTEHIIEVQNVDASPNVTITSVRQ